VTCFFGFDCFCLGPLNAIVSVTAVDRAIYSLYNASRLARKQLFKKMEEFDQGCVKNGGENGIDVFGVSTVVQDAAQ